MGPLVIIGGLEIKVSRRKQRHQILLLITELETIYVKEYEIVKTYRNF